MKALLLPLIVLGLPGTASLSQPPPSTDELLQRVAVHVDADELDEALALLEPAAADPASPPQVRAFLGAIYVETGRNAEALAVLGPMAEAPEADPAVLYNAGRAAVGAGEFQRGAGYLQRSVEMVPQSPAARELGLLLGQNEMYSQALVLLRPWVSAHPDDQEARLAAAFCAVSLERAPDAEELLSDLPQDNPRVRLLWGKVLLLQGDPHGSLATLRPLLEEAPPEIEMDVRRSMSQAHILTGEGAEAVALLEGRVGENPAAALQLAHAQHQSGDLASALATLEPFYTTLLEGEAPAPGRPGAELAAGILLESGRLLSSLGRQTEAVPALELSTRLDPQEKQTWQAYGQALAATGQRDEARAALERFREIGETEIPPVLYDVQLQADAADPTARRLREALRLAALGRPEEALMAARQEAELAPEDPRPMLVVSRTLLQMDQADGALEAADRAVALAPEEPDGYYQRGVVEGIRGDVAAAEADLQRALELQPDHTAALNDLAVLLMNGGRTDEARGLLERVLEIRPDDRMARQNLDQLDQESQ